MEPYTKADLAYRLLRRAIVVGEISGNEPLDEVALVGRFGTGRTPMREALKRLAQEQFIVWSPRRSPFVRDLSLQELLRLYESRMVMEVPAARLAATRVNAAHWPRFSGRAINCGRRLTLVMSIARSRQTMHSILRSPVARTIGSLPKRWIA